MDLSDGLHQDLRRLGRASGTGACVWFDRLPTHPVLEALPADTRTRCQLAGGEDYQLLFTAPPSAQDAILALARDHEVLTTRIGELTPESTVRVIGAVWPRGFEHFSSDAP